MDPLSPFQLRGNDTGLEPAISIPTHDMVHDKVLMQLTVLNESPLLIPAT